MTTNPTSNDDWADDRWDDFYAGLRSLQAACRPGKNRNHEVIVLAVACLGEGINTIGRIIKVLAPLGYGNRHVASVVKSEMGSRWREGADGTLSELSGN